MLIPDEKQIQELQEKYPDWDVQATVDIVDKNWDIYEKWVAAGCYNGHVDFLSFDVADFQMIVNPFCDYTCREWVDPIEEYGDDFINSALYVKKNMNEPQPPTE